MDLDFGDAGSIREQTARNVELVEMFDRGEPLLPPDLFFLRDWVLPEGSPCTQVSEFDFGFDG